MPFTWAGRAVSLPAAENYSLLRHFSLYKLQIRGIIPLAAPERAADGGVAQLGERSVRIREVEGSNPFVSTK